MGELRQNDKNEKGVLSIIDGMIFGVIIIVVMILIFQMFGGASYKEKDLRSTTLRKEAAEDIQDTALASIIEKTGFMNESGEQSIKVEYENITVERAVKEYLYLAREDKKNEYLDYDLSELEKDIEETYSACAWEVSKYHFAVESSFQRSALFVSDTVGTNSTDDLPADRGAATSTVLIDQEPVDITLYIWR
ncbi:MAG: hypothetical protein ACLFSM_06190 [Thermoplasmata archaeon]